MERALLLAIEHRISAYDAQYLELAASYGVPLVSEDKKLQRMLPHRAFSMADFAASIPYDNPDA
jgi:predicted nucleic acid-binding protein